MNVEQKNRRVGMLLAFVLVGVIVYSFVVITTRGRLPEPTNLTRLQRILRGL